MEQKLNILKYYGGKYKLLDYILPFPEHTIYIEPFGGSAVVLLNKAKSEVEIYNDHNKVLVNFWEVLKTHYIQLKQLCKYEICSRERFEHFKKMLEDFENQRMVESAFMFFYCNAYSFSGLGTFMGIHKHKAMAQISYRNKIKRFKTVHERIRDVLFEKQDFRVLFDRILKDFDLPQTLLYIDPPYFKGKEGYQIVMGNEKIWLDEFHNILRKYILQLNHAKVVISIDHGMYIQGHKWNCQKIKRINKASQKDNSSIHLEYIYRNFDNSVEKKMNKKNIKKLSDF